MRLEELEGFNSSFLNLHNKSDGSNMNLVLLHKTSQYKLCTNSQHKPCMASQDFTIQIDAAIGFYIKFTTKLGNFCCFYSINPKAAPKYISGAPSKNYRWLAMN